ncbi:MAG: hypothetical protein ACIAQZ_14535 [Sedimentisphaeraceae bacterium JB056]
MDVKIKNLDAEMALKAKGMELDVKGPGGKSTVGTLAVKKSGLVWTKGKAKPVNITWKKFLAIVDDMTAPKAAAKPAAKKATKKAAKKTTKKAAAKKATKKVAKKATKKAAPKKAVKKAVKKVAKKAKKATKKATKKA